MRVTSRRSSFTKICCFNINPINLGEGPTDTLQHVVLMERLQTPRVPVNSDHCHRSIYASFSVGLTNGAPSLPSPWPDPRSRGTDFPYEPPLHLLARFMETCVEIYCWLHLESSFILLFSFFTAVTVPNRTGCGPGAGMYPRHACEGLACRFNPCCS